MVCSFGVLLFRTKDSLKFVAVWKEEVDSSHYINKKFPLEDEKL